MLLVLFGSLDTRHRPDLDPINLITALTNFLQDEGVGSQLELIEAQNAPGGGLLITEMTGEVHG